MTKIVILLLLIVSANYTFSQSPGKSGVSMTQCDGAINIFENGDFIPQFTGVKGTGLLIESYPSLTKIDSKNAMWLSYIAPSDGDLTFSASVGKGYLQMVVFEELGGDICGEIESGESKIKRIHTKKEEIHLPSHSFLVYLPIFIFGKSPPIKFGMHSKALRKTKTLTTSVVN